MAQQRTRALSEVLDQLESAVDGDSIPVRDVVGHFGRKSFASLMLVFSLISTSPASAIPGVTAVVAALVFTFGLPHQGGPPAKLEFRRLRSPCWAARSVA